MVELLGSDRTRALGLLRRSNLATTIVHSRSTTAAGSAWTGPNSLDSNNRGFVDWECDPDSVFSCLGLIIYSRVALQILPRPRG